MTTVAASMSALNRLLSPLRDAAVAFFRSDVAVHRSEAGVQIVLEERARGPAKPVKPRKSSREDVATRRDRDELALTLQQLASLLDRCV